jgi:GntR family transcriptional regulator
MDSDDIALRFGPVSQATPGPLYAQIIGNVRREVAAARLQPNECLPSTRVLAAALSVSVITVSRAYEELERTRIVYSRQGQGTYVAQDAQDQLRAEDSEIWTALVRADEIARRSNIADEDVVEMLRTVQGRKKGR